MARVPAALGQTPVFVRAGAVLTVWPAMMHVGEIPLDAIELWVFAPERSAVRLPARARRSSVLRRA